MRLLMITAIAAASLAAAGGADAVSPPPSAPAFHPLLKSIAADVKPDGLKATIDKLVGFGTRHTLSDTRSDTRGIGAARRWVKSRFEEISKDCGGCLTIETPTDTSATVKSTTGTKTGRLRKH